MNVIVYIIMCNWIALWGFHQNYTKEEIFRWFPLGNFTNISHFDKAASEKEMTSFWFKDYQVIFPDRLTLTREELLPPSLRNQCESMTCVHLADLKFKKGSGPKAFAEKPYVEVKQMVEKGQTFMVWKDVGEKMIVWRFDLLEPVIKEMIKRGELEETGEYVFERPIYIYRTETSGGPRYAYITETQEFLSAKRLATVELMVAAGMGQEMGFLEDDWNIQLLDVLPYLGQYWEAYNSRRTFEEQLNKMKERGFSGKDIENMEDVVEYGPLFGFETCVLSDKIVTKLIRLYKSAKGAEEFGCQPPRTDLYDQIPEPRRKFKMLADQRRTCELKGNIEIDSLEYDEELLKVQKEVKAQFEKLWSERRKTLGQEKEKH